MKTRSTGALIVGLASVLALGGSPAGAGTAMGPEIVDQAGDANFLNRNGGWLVRSGTNEIPPDFSVVTPEDIRGADITAMWFETAYATVSETDPESNLSSSRAVPTGLLIKIKTTDPPRPSFGPSLIFRLPASIRRCELWFEGVVTGPLSVPGDVEAARIRKISTAANPCPGGSATISTGFSLSSQGNVLTLSYPFAALPYSSTELVLAKDVVIGLPLFPSVHPHVTELTQSAYLIGVAQFGAPIIDQTRLLATKFMIGSDIPSPSRVEITCATATQQANPWERISDLGGTNPDGTAWKLTQAAALQGVEQGKWTFSVEDSSSGQKDVVVAAIGTNQYLKAADDPTQPESLLSLPGCA